MKGGIEMNKQKEKEITKETLESAVERLKRAFKKKYH